MEFSIIINCRNTEDYLDLCLKSIKLFGLKDAEIIVVDGGTRKQKNVCKKLCKSYKAIYVDNRKDGGIERNYGRQNNKGIKISKGKFIIFFNEDTVVSKDWIKLFYKDYIKCIKKYKVGLIGCRSNFISGLQNIRLCFTDKIVRSNRISTTCAMIKKETLNDVGWFDESMETWNGHDFDLSYRLILKGYNNFIGRTYIHHFGHAATNRAKINIKNDLKRALTFLKLKHGNNLQRKLI